MLKTLQNLYLMPWELIWLQRINMFLRQTIRENGIPFELKLDKPNKVTLAAIERGRRIAYDETVKGYTDMAELKGAWRMMYTVKFTGQFKKDLKLAKKQGRDLEKMYYIIEKLARGENLGS